MKNSFLFIIFIFTNIVVISSFRLVMSGSNYSDRKLYTSYLLGLRKTRRVISNNSNVNMLKSIVNFTNDFAMNYTSIQEYQYINNTKTGVKNIAMSNMVIDVSNIKEIHISTKNDKLIIELDKNKESRLIPLLNNANSVETIINVISLFGKMMNS